MKHRTTSFFSFSRKKILWFLAIFMLSGVVLQGNVGLIQETHAQTANWPVQKSTATTITNSSDQSLDTISMIDIILKMVYVLLWPLLVLAGWSLDNTLVYGSFFHLDAPLWKFWNMMKNFANFTLWFLVLFAIIKSIFSNSWAGSTDKDNTPLNIIKKTLIAGVLIQASWFLTSALIDVSTVATYAVGGLPLNVIKNTDIWSQKILSVNAKLDLNKFSNPTIKGKNFEVSYGAGKYNLSSCAMSNNGEPSSSAKYIVGRTTTDGTEPGYCVLFGNTVVPFDEIGLHTAYFALFGWSTETDYTLFIQNAGVHLNDWVLTERNDKWYIVDITSAKFASAKATGKTWLDTTAATTLSDVVNKSKWFVWVLATMYSSLLNFSQISDTSITSLGAVSGEVIIKAAIAVALLIPLIALTVVLIMRVGFLRLVIAISPFLILNEVFKIDAIKKWLDKIGLSLTNIVSVIFAPVITVFALSISLVFLSTLIKSFTPATPTTGTTINTALSPDIQQVPTDKADTQKVVVLKLFGLEFQNFTRWGSLDRFSWLIVNLVAVGLLRAVLFAAIRANSLGEKFAKPIQEFWQNMMGTLPIVPLPGGENVGVMSGASVLSNAPDRWLSTINNEQEAKARSIIEWTPTTTSTAPSPEQYTKIATGLASNSKLDLTSVNEGRKEDAHITETNFLNNNDYISGVANAIEDSESKLKDEEKNTAYSALWKLWWGEFEKKVKDSEMDDVAIATALNSNQVTKTYAATITELTSKKGKFKIAPNTDNDTKTKKPYLVTSLGK